MKTPKFIKKQTVIAGATALTMLSAPILMTDTFSSIVANAGFISEANAGEHSDKGHSGAGSKQQGAGGHGTTSGGKKGMSKVLDESDDDSDRPAWAQGNK